MSNLINKKINSKKSRKKIILNLLVLESIARKGMDKTINITRNLNKKGFKANLKIIGSINFSKNFPKYISQIGLLIKILEKNI